MFHLRHVSNRDGNVWLRRGQREFGISERQRQGGARRPSRRGRCSAKQKEKRVRIGRRHGDVTPVVCATNSWPAQCPDWSPWSASPLRAWARLRVCVCVCVPPLQKRGKIVKRSKCSLTAEGAVSHSSNGGFSSTASRAVRRHVRH